MTPRRTLELVGAGLVLIALIVVAYEWHLSEVRGAELNATIAAAKQAQAAMDKRQAEVDKARDDKIAALEADKSRTQTPSQIIKEVPVYLPQNLREPIKTVTQPAPVGAKDQTPVVTGAMVPAADFKAIFDQLVECKECAAKLEADEADKKIQADKLASVTMERDEAIRAVKGGTFWQRIRHDGKLILVSVAVGGGLGYALHR